MSSRGVATHGAVWHAPFGGFLFERALQQQEHLRSDVFINEYQCTQAVLGNGATKHITVSGLLYRAGHWHPASRLVGFVVVVYKMRRVPRQGINRGKLVDAEMIATPMGLCGFTSRVEHVRLVLVLPTSALWAGFRAQMPRHVGGGV